MKATNNPEMEALFADLGGGLAVVIFLWSIAIAMGTLGSVSG